MYSPLINVKAKQLFQKVWDNLQQLKKGKDIKIAIIIVDSWESQEPKQELQHLHMQGKRSLIKVCPQSRPVRKLHICQKSACLFHLAHNLGCHK